MARQFKITKAGGNFLNGKKCLFYFFLRGFLSLIFWTIVQRHANLLNIYIFVKALDSNLGKLEVNLVDTDDNGDYECTLPDGHRYRYRITAVDVPSIVWFETRSQLKVVGGFYLASLYESVEQVCSSVTTSNYLNVEWRNQNGNVF